MVKKLKQVLKSSLMHLVARTPEVRTYALYIRAMLHAASLACPAVQTCDV